MTTQKTEVIYRIFNDEMIAIFPAIASGTHSRYCLSYQFIGQHGDCLPGWIMQQSTAVTADRTDELHEMSQELASMGYDLKRVYNHTAKYQEVRRQQLADMGL